MDMHANLFIQNLEFLSSSVKQMKLRVYDIKLHIRHSRLVSVSVTLYEVIFIDILHVSYTLGSE